MTNFIFAENVIICCFKNENIRQGRSLILLKIYQLFFLTFPLIKSINDNLSPLELLLYLDSLIINESSKTIFVICTKFVSCQMRKYASSLRRNYQEMVQNMHRSQLFICESSSIISNRKKKKSRINNPRSCKSSFVYTRIFLSC